MTTIGWIIRALLIMVALGFGNRLPYPWYWNLAIIVAFVVVTSGIVLAIELAPARRNK